MGEVEIRDDGFASDLLDNAELEDLARPWVCPWSLPVGRPGHEAVRAICVVPVPHGDDAGHVAVVDSVPVLFGADVGEKR